MHILIHSRHQPAIQIFEMLIVQVIVSDYHFQQTVKCWFS